MQFARTLSDGKTWEAFTFSKLPTSDLEEKRKNLACAECGEFAWFRKESLHGHPAHFCAHHKDDCSLKVNYVVIDDPRNEGTNFLDQITAGNNIVIDLDKEKGGEVDVSNVQPHPTGTGEGGGTRFVSGRNFGESAQHFTLRRILHRLVQSPAFRLAEDQIIFKKNEDDILLSGKVKDVVVEFSDINKNLHHEQLLLYWGPIASAGYTADGRLWLNSSANRQSASIMIFTDILTDFLSLFKITDATEDLLGAHVLILGRCYYSAGSNKPVIRCTHPKYILVRRYRDDRLTNVS
ncbi:hypothetical protein ACO0K7_18845 [Undibacterium sp. Ji67W]|uniref:hypothetical protein n=1 Tax=Undibacterium sp. Ji67W TaxID=3413042 RepID=UPI003BF0C1CD